MPTEHGLKITLFIGQWFKFLESCLHHHKRFLRDQSHTASICQVSTLLYLSCTCDICQTSCSWVQFKHWCVWNALPSVIAALLELAAENNPMQLGWKSLIYPAHLANKSPLDSVPRAQWKKNCCVLLRADSNHNNTDVRFSRQTYFLFAKQFEDSSAAGDGAATIGRQFRWYARNGVDPVLQVQCTLVLAAKLSSC